MGERGPAPNRSDQVRRRNAGEDGIPVTSVPRLLDRVTAPPLGFVTHDVAMDMYASLAQSAQALYYEPSDWAYARMLTMETGRMLNAGKPSGQLLSAITSAWSDLLTTEGQRRRLRFEIDRAPAEEDDTDDAAILSLADRLKSVGE